MRSGDFVVDHMLLKDSQLAAQGEYFEIFLQIGHEMGFRAATYDLQKVHVEHPDRMISFHFIPRTGSSQGLLPEFSRHNGNLLHSMSDSMCRVVQK